MMVSSVFLLLVVLGVSALIAAAVAAVVVLVSRGSGASRSNNPNLRPCPDCGRPISVRAIQCPHCGGPTKAV